MARKKTNQLGSGKAGDSEVTEAVFVYVTTPNLDLARKIGREVVEKKQAACANILPQMESIYSWQGEICEGNEAVLILKTQKQLLRSL